MGPGSLLFWSPLALLRLGVDGEGGYIAHSQSSPFSQSLWLGLSLGYQNLACSQHLRSRGLQRALAAEQECVAVGFGRVSLSLHFTVKGTWLALRPRNACSHKLHSTTTVTARQLASATSLSQSPLRAVHCTLVITSSTRFTFTSISTSSSLTAVP
jgi:hypothetical protein